MAAFIKFDGVDGEAMDQDHQHWSNLGSFNQGIEALGGTKTPVGVRRGTVVPDDILCTKELDKSSPKLAEAALKQKRFPTVVIHVAAPFTDGAHDVYYAYELKKVVVTSYRVSGSGENSELPIEEIALSFQEMKVTYTEHNTTGASRGNVEYSWKSDENAKAKNRGSKKRR